MIATDIAPDMVAFAAQRAAAAGLSNVQAHEMDAEAIDLPDASVDAVLCRLGLMFLPDLDRALAGGLPGARSRRPVRCGDPVAARGPASVAAYRRDP